MIGGRRVSATTAAVVGVAAIWPFLVGSASAHRAGIELLVLVLVGLSLTVTVGWLQLPTLFQPAAVAVAAWAAARLLASGQGIPLALLASAAAGACVALIALVPVLRHPRPGLVVTSFVLSGVVWAVVVPRFLIRSFTRPVVVGIDLAGDRALYLAGLILVGATYAAVHNLHRSDVGRRLAAVGASPALAARSGVSTRRSWVSGVAIAGAVAGVAGLLFALQQQSVPPAVAVSPAVAVGMLAVPFIGGAPWPAGAVLGGVVLTIAPRLLGWNEVPQALPPLLLLVALLVLRQGLLGLVRGRDWYVALQRGL